MRSVCAGAFGDELDDDDGGDDTSRQLGRGNRKLCRSMASLVLSLSINRLEAKTTFASAAASSICAEDDFDDGQLDVRSDNLAAEWVRLLDARACNSIALLKSRLAPPIRELFGVVVVVVVIEPSSLADCLNDFRIFGMPLLLHSFGFHLALERAACNL